MSETTQTPRGPGRPPRTAEVAATRRRRTDTGPTAGLKLHVPADMKDEANFEYRWANDRPGRIRQLTIEDDWDVVSTDRPDQLTAAADGSVMRRAVDKATGDNAVLLRKPRQFFEADRLEKQKPVDAIEKALRHGPAPSSEGISGSEAYVPGGKNTIGR